MLEDNCNPLPCTAVADATLIRNMKNTHIYIYLPISTYVHAHMSYSLNS